MLYFRLRPHVFPWSRYANELWLNIRLKIKSKHILLYSAHSGDYANELICIPRTWEYMESKPYFLTLRCPLMRSYPKFPIGPLWRPPDSMKNVWVFPSVIAKIPQTVIMLEKNILQIYYEFIMSNKKVAILGLSKCIILSHSWSHSKR